VLRHLRTKAGPVRPEPRAGESVERACPEPRAGESVERACPEPRAGESVERACPEPRAGESVERACPEPRAGESVERACPEPRAGESVEGGTRSIDRSCFDRLSTNGGWLFVLFAEHEQLLVFRFFDSTSDLPVRPEPRTGESVERACPEPRAGESVEGGTRSIDRSCFDRLSTNGGSCSCFDGLNTNALVVRVSTGSTRTVFVVRDPTGMLDKNHGISARMEVGCSCFDRAQHERRLVVHASTRLSMNGFTGIAPGRSGRGTAPASHRFHTRNWPIGGGRGCRKRSSSSASFSP
jgi:hypothetical protein